MGRGAAPVGRAAGDRWLPVEVVLIVPGYLGVVFGRLIRRRSPRRGGFLGGMRRGRGFHPEPGGAGGGAAGGSGRLGDPASQNHHVPGGRAPSFAGGTGKAVLRLTSTHPPGGAANPAAGPEVGWELRPDGGCVPAGSALDAPSPSSAPPPLQAGWGNVLPAGAPPGVPRGPLVATAELPQPTSVGPCPAPHAEVPTPLREAGADPRGGGGHPPGAGFRGAPRGLAQVGRLWMGWPPEAVATPPPPPPRPPCPRRPPRPRPPHLPKFAPGGRRPGGGKRPRRTAELEGPVRQLDPATPASPFWDWPLTALRHPSLGTGPTPSRSHRAKRSWWGKRKGESERSGPPFRLRPVPHAAAERWAAGPGEGPTPRPGSDAPLPPPGGKRRFSFRPVTWAHPGGTGRGWLWLPTAGPPPPGGRGWGPWLTRPSGAGRG